MIATIDVVLITAHDLGRHLHCYGVPTVRSPNLDRLAAEGVRFSQAFATAPQCSPSRASIATGRYPHNHGVMGLAHPGFDWELAPGIAHAAAIFAAAGYETHLFGLQHVTSQPERLGFDHLHAPASHDAPAHGDRVAAAVEAFLSSALGERPLYLEINVEETHRPYPALGRGRMSGSDVALPAYLPHTAEVEEELRALQRSIDGLDAAVERVIAALARAGRLEKTLLIFTTDHGLAMPRAKCTLYDPGIEVALILRWPDGDLGRGRIISELVSNIDLLPSLLDALEIPIPSQIQGRSFMPLLRNERAVPRSEIFAEKTYHSYYDPLRCIRTRTHKYIGNFETGFAVEVAADVQAGAIFRSDPSRYSTDRQFVTELYDLIEDPTEQHNLIGQRDDLERDLGQRLLAWMRETDDPLLRGPIASPRYRQALNAVSGSG